VTQSHDQRRADREYLDELHRRVGVWDPIGLLALGAPEDEYDCMLGPLVSGLRDGLTPSQLAQLLRDQFAGHFGEEPSNSEQFAAQITDWRRSARST
jgi:hypothetical protein